MIKVGIIGATGYAGAELARLIYQHKEAQVVWYGSRSYRDKKYSQVFGSMTQIIDMECIDDGNDNPALLLELAKQVDVIFTATPQGLCASILTEEILKNTKVIDLSADFRIKDVNTYEQWYGIKHLAPQFIQEAIYGLCEINRKDIKNARVLANPGCYTTCSILTVYPLVKEGLIDTDSIIIDAKSGVSGAGRGAKVANLYTEVNESIKAYGILSHRHTPEIEEQLNYASSKESEDIKIVFTPHLVPMNRGILVTAYANLKEGVNSDMVRAAYEKYYKEEEFVRVLEEGVFPETRWVSGSNYTDINFKVDERTNKIVMIGALDNVLKGAAGQAVQNMNIMFGLKENEGLLQLPMFL